ncbi:MAG: PadR family transcriptional regulator [Chloroflexota bacterium]|nr:PadR family transcriptional regulator [Chloroflexota bacterium]
MMTSTLGYALLNLIACEPQTGYDLSRTLQERISFFWQAKHSQIYPELAKLESAGFITHEVVRQNDKPDKKIYTLTDAGLAALRAWVVAPLEMSPARDELLVKTAAIWQADPAQAAALFRDHERQHAEQLALYEGIRATLEEEWERSGRRRDLPWFGSYLTLMRGISYEREYRDWCRWAAEMVETRD